MRADERDSTSSASLSQRHPLSLARNPKADDGHRSIAVYLLDANWPRFMGTVGVPDRYPLGADRGSALPLLSPRTRRKTHPG